MAAYSDYHCDTVNLLEKPFWVTFMEVGLM